MKPFNMDAYQYLKRNNPHSGGTETLMIRSLYPAYPTKLSIKDTKKERLHFSNKWVGVNEKFPYEVEITVPWYWFSHSNFSSIPKSSAITIAGGSHGIPRNWTSKIGLETLNILQSLLDSRKTLRKKTVPFLFAGLGFSALPHLWSRHDRWIPEHYPRFGNLPLKIFFLFSKRSDAEKYVKQLKSTRAFKALKMKTKIRNFSEPKPGTQSAYSKMGLYDNYMFWDRRALMTESKSKSKLPPLFTPLSEWSSTQSTKSGTKMPTKKSKSTHKKLTVTKVKTEAKKYAKSRSKKKWQTLAKKFGMKQAQRIVKAAKKLEPKKKSMKRGSRKSLRPVVDFGAVSGNRTPPFAIPKGKKFPIGTLAYAKKAIDYLTWDAEPKVRKYNAYHVMTAVKKRYPQYNWARYWNELRTTVKNAKKLKSWSEYTKR